MKHTDYISLTSLFVELLDKYELFTKVFEKDKDGKATVKAKANKMYSLRFEILDICESEISTVIALMDSNVNGFVQDLRDASNTPGSENPDVLSLIDAMDKCSTRMAQPIKGIASLFIPIVTRCNDWMNQSRYYLPSTVTDVSRTDEGSKRKGIVFKTDGKDLAKFFIPGFTNKDPISGQCPFDRFWSCMTDNRREICKKDILRIAMEIQASKYLLPHYRNEAFTKWVRCFCNATGIAVPKYIKKPLDGKNPKRIPWIIPFL